MYLYFRAYTRLSSLSLSFALGRWGREMSTNSPHPHPFGLDTVVLAALFAESVFYGIFVILFCASTVILLRENGKKLSLRSSRRINRPMLCALITMFILATIHIAVSFQRVLDAFLVYPHTEEGTIGYLSVINSPIFVLKNTAYATQTLVGDAFILYRLYLVWSGDKRVVMPMSISFIASVVLGIGALQGFGRAGMQTLVFAKQLQHWIASFFAMSLFTNFTSTLLIAGRIWWTQRQSVGALGLGSHGMRSAMVLIIESGAIYSVCLVFLLSLYLSGSLAQFIFVDSVTQIIGIVFSMVIVRVALGISSERATHQEPHPVFSANSRLGETSATGSFNLNTLNIQVTTVSESDLDDKTTLQPDWETGEAFPHAHLADESTT